MTWVRRSDLNGSKRLEKQSKSRFREKNEAPRQKKYHYARRKKHVKALENFKLELNESFCGAFGAKIGPYGSTNYADDDYEVGFKPNM